LQFRYRGSRRESAVAQLFSLGVNSRIDNMAAPKAKTLQERFGFLDPDIRKPEHDDIIRWLDANIEDILMLVFGLSVRPKDVFTKWEPVVRQKEDGGLMIGFVDFIARWSDTIVVFEAKTEIETLGVLFRQVRMYQEGYIGRRPVWDMKFVVVCPDDTEADKIREQRLLFLKLLHSDDSEFGCFVYQSWHIS
jgi:hypothetical protein